MKKSKTVFSSLSNNESIRMNPNETSFLFLDECMSPDPAISSLTGIVVPIPDFGRLRSAFYETLAWAINPRPGVIDLSPVELHGSDLLRDRPDADDELRMRVLSEVVGLITDNQVDIYRVGYYTSKRLQAAFAGDPTLVGLCWGAMLTALQPLMQRSEIIPVMDGLSSESVRQFSQAVRQLDIMRSVGMEDCLSIRHSQNILGEVFYADSRYSVFTQIADIVSYLRHVADLDREARSMTDFKKELLRISRSLEPAIAVERIVPMTIDGQRITPGEGYAYSRG